MGLPYEIDIIASALLCLSVMFGTIVLSAIISWFNPIMFLSIKKDITELKHLDQETADKVKKTGILTKFAFRTFNSGAERYF